MEIKLGILLLFFSLALEHVIIFHVSSIFSMEPSVMVEDTIVTK